ncbi:MAG: hypothetical protein K0Q85_1374, partial [Caproiciproducens sp.]|nr:hypothetical protein [Caproiciproducens sp.]
MVYINTPRVDINFKSVERNYIVTGC